MKKILIVSATSNSNYQLAKDLEGILVSLDAKVSVLSLEDYILPLYTTKKDELSSKDDIQKVKELTDFFINNDGIIIAGPEYNGSIAPIITNSIAWISTTTNYWRDAFLNKIGLVVTSSGGGGNKFLVSMKTQLEHLGVVVMPRFICINNSSPLKKDSSEKILKQFINLI